MIVETKAKYSVGDVVWFAAIPNGPDGFSVLRGVVDAVGMDTEDSQHVYGLKGLILLSFKEDELHPNTRQARRHAERLNVELTRNRLLEQQAKEKETT